METSEEGQAAVVASTSFFMEKWRVPKEGRSGPLPEVSRTMSMLYMNQGHVKRVDTRIIIIWKNDSLDQVGFGQVCGYLRYAL